MEAEIMFEYKMSLLIFFSHEAQGTYTLILHNMVYVLDSLESTYLRHYMCHKTRSEHRVGENFIVSRWLA
jgi:hypothetical protein